MKAQRGYTEVAFPSEGAALRGRWYPPADPPAPAVIMTHGLSATIPMVTDRYAEVLQAGGLGVLLYDHRNLGASDGQPRQEINPWIQGRGYRDAISYVATLNGVDPERIALWGDSLSASVALVVAGVDDRPAAVVAQVPATGRVAAPPDPDGELAVAVRRTLESGDVAGPEHTLGPLPVVSHDQLGSPSVLKPIQAYRWFIDYGGRFGTGWTNRITLVRPPTPAPFHAGLVAHQVRCPVLMQVSPHDEIPDADPQVARSVHDRLAGERMWQEIDGGHFGLLHHPGDLFDQASAAQVQFLRDTLMG
ncbi:MAG: hypothetical protein R6U94_01100 [Nitriliruptoraceae bacterium]